MTGSKVAAHHACLPYGCWAANIARSPSCASRPILQRQRTHRRFWHVCNAPRRGLCALPATKRAILTELKDAAYTGALFSLWYLSNIYFNIFNKRALSAFMYPITCTWIHLAVGSALAVALWLTRVKQAPQLSPRVVDIIFPLSILHLAGFAATNASLGAVAVSLTHTIKSMEPFFTVVFSWLLMGTQPARRVLLSLLPIVMGVGVASATDLSFTWAGFNAAMASNVAFQLRNVLSKKAMLRSSFDSLEGASNGLISLDEVNIFAMMSIGACMLMTPIFFATDGTVLISAGWNPAQWMPAQAWKESLLAGVCRFGDVLASFLILQRVSPVSHSVGNCVKRVVVIAASIIVFKTAASNANIAGTAMALTGVLLYSLAKRSSPSAVHADKVTQTTIFEDLVGAVSPGTLYGKWVESRKALEPRDEKGEEDLEYYL